MSILGDKQELFALLIAQHEVWLILEMGYAIRNGHALRCQNCPVGRKTSSHKNKLAKDINLFKEGKFLTTTEDHRFSGEKWESRHELCRWGGRFKDSKGNSDGNHYSLLHNGRR